MNIKEGCPKGKLPAQGCYTQARSGFDLLIKSGTVVTESAVMNKDLGIKGGKIAAVEDKLDGPAKRVIDAEGKYVFPGVIDVHVHLNAAVSRTVSSDNFRTGTIAAACGGTTAIIDFATQEQGQAVEEAVAERLQDAAGKAVIDYGFHIALTDINEQTLAAIPSLVEEGFPSFKLYMTYRFRVDDGEMLRVLAKVKDNGGLVCVHAENHHMIDYLIEEYRRTGKTSPKFHPLSRPLLAEWEATNRAIKLSRLVKAPIYIVHVTCGKSLSEIVQAREQGYPVMGETCPQYLLLDEDRYKSPGFEGAKYVMSPPLRPLGNQAVLWNGLADGDLQVVSTDHCPFFYKGQKELGRDFFGDIPNGAPGIEARPVLLYTYGVGQGRMSLQQFVSVVSANPAKIFGLYPEKGTIAVGSDADLVIFDPQAEMTLTKGILHENVDYTPYEGAGLKGFPVATIARGEVIVENGDFVGKDGRGKLLKRKRPDLI